MEKETKKVETKKNVINKIITKLYFSPKTMEVLRRAVNVSFPILLS